MLELSDEDDTQRNGERFERLWEEERERCGETESPSLTRVAWRFARVRFIICLVLVSFSMVAQFIGPSVLLKLILDYLEDPTLEVEVGVVLVVLLFFNQLLRNITYNLQQSICIHTGRSGNIFLNIFINKILEAIRLLGGLQYVGYAKLLRLASPDDSALGQLVTLITGDHPRIQEACIMGPLIIATPIMFLISIVYTVYLSGVSSIAGFAVLIIYYPVMVN